ncbi:Inactive (p)ppGpp 3'-pyrophosphohydrolase domain / GTP pyrophosphokinase, (p)ppGpp synthetase I [hydrothermal vent metagenome]|uniref:Inactive (P)ppGpp 3'-pyrophosphohydrolase domain / GTP pyrophosphokinase, (P)ppGpp synthetase I n=1 Tax=hydrothermal vent metagenome TaxID=652676 RepID=A0A3B1A045_9ZZZZ
MVTTVQNYRNFLRNNKISCESWFETFEVEYAKEELIALRHAYQLTEKSCSGISSITGEPAFYYALAVTDILIKIKLDYQTLITALLYEAWIHTELTINDIQQECGNNIATLVEGVEKMDAIHFTHNESQGVFNNTAHAETLRKMLLAMVEDVRVVLVKLADRVQCMRTLPSTSAVYQDIVARETLDLFAPLANRLGIWQIKWELEDLAFRYINPDLYKKIARLLNEKRLDREAYIEKFITILNNELKKMGVKASLTGRPKHIYSIYRKMTRKAVDYSQIYDVRAVRVMVKELRDCYAVLGIVHSLWQYISGEFDDYIATPKGNDYRSLHTAVIGPNGKTVEVQIRTYDMHQHSEYGVAAHWQYKEGGSREERFEEKIAWLRHLLEWKDEVNDLSDFVEKVKTDVFADRVYVFTPNGDVVDLPNGSTPLDFAYYIHSEIGHRCRGAKVNGRMVPLTYTVKNGEKVEILTIKNGNPSRDWLNSHLGYLNSVKARSKVSQWFKQQNTERLTASGKEAIEKELDRLGLNALSHERLSKAMNLHSAERLYAAVGRNDLRLGRVAHVAEKLLGRNEAKQPAPLIPQRGSSRLKESTDVRICGVGNLLTRMSLCCKPVPGDDVTGYITKGRGVAIHRTDCSHVLRYNSVAPERLIEVRWGQENEKTYPVDIEVTAYDRSGLLRDISAALANEEINVLSVATHSIAKSHRAQMNLVLEVSDLEKLSRVLAKITQLPNIIGARRKV